jgi:hypothetical protein
LFNHFLSNKLQDKNRNINISVLSGRLKKKLTNIYESVEAIHVPEEIPNSTPRPQKYCPSEYIDGKIIPLAGMRREGGKDRELKG